MNDIDIRFVPCEGCGTEGFIEHGHPNAPDPEWVEVCPDCKGERVIEVAVEPITLEDLEEIPLHTQGAKR
jgi:hypothetical protein